MEKGLFTTAKMGVFTKPNYKQTFYLKENDKIYANIRLYGLKIIAFCLKYFRVNITVFVQFFGMFNIQLQNNKNKLSQIKKLGDFLSQFLLNRALYLSQSREMGIFTIWRKKP